MAELSAALITAPPLSLTSPVSSPQQAKESTAKAYFGEYFSAKNLAPLSPNLLLDGEGEDEAPPKVTVRQVLYRFHERNNPKAIIKGAS